VKISTRLRVRIGSIPSRVNGDSAELPSGYNAGSVVAIVGIY
jgi:hypothetical protein